MSRNAETLQAARDRATALGRCPICRKREAKPGRRCCVECIFAQSTRKEQRISNGLCPCGEPPRPNRGRCAHCANVENARARRYYAAKVAAGICGLNGCNDPARPGLTKCEKHRGTL